MAFIDETRSDHIGCAHQKVGDLSDASCGGGQKLQGVFDKFNEQTGERSKGKCADECREVGQIHLGKGRRQRHGKFHKGKNIRHCGKQGGHGDGTDIEGGSSFRLLHGNRAVHNAPILRICLDLKQPHRTGFPAGLLPHIFFHPDYTVGYGISPYRALLRFADFTAG